MSKEINHWCVVCGKGYHACDSCNEIKSFTPWRSLTDSIEHFKIFTVLKDYNNKLIDKNEAREMLSNVNLSDKDSFKESSKKLIDEIFKEDAVTSKASKKKSFNKTVEDSEIKEEHAAQDSDTEE